MGSKHITESDRKIIIDDFLNNKDNTAPEVSKRTSYSIGVVNKVITQHLDLTMKNGRLNVLKRQIDNYGID